jgi:tetratricopeptide (TPR) repeat protein
MSSIRRCVIAALAAVAAMSAVPVSPARADEPSAEDDQRARELFRMGESHYAAGRYEKSAVLYDEAYRLSGRAELLLAIVNTYERMGDYKQAIARLREYLKHPRARNIGTLRDRLRRLEAAERVRQEEQDRIRKLEIADQQRARELRSLREEGQRPREASQPEQPAEKPPEASRLPAYLFLGGGVVGLAGAVGFGIVSNQAGQDAEAACGGGGLCQASAEKDLDRELKFAIFSDASAVVGIASAGVGVYLLWRRRGESREARQALQIAPTLVPGGLGVGVVGDL